jgi:hypothetical protein
MAVTNSPNMSLPVPVVGQEAGPQYAQDVNDSLAILDQHNHSAGSGVQITPAGINITTALSFNSNAAINLTGLTLVARGTTPAAGTIYQAADGFLWYVNGITGNAIQITNAGGVAGSPGSIANLTPPASASYVAASSSFVWQSDINTAANMDFGSATLRDLSPNSTYGYTLNPPTGLGSNISINLPSLPSSQKIMTLDAAGNMAAPYTVDGTTITIQSNKLVASAGVPDGVTIQSSGGMLSVRNGWREHAWELNGPFSLLSMPQTNIDSTFIAPYNIIIQSVWIFVGNQGSSGATIYDLIYQPDPRTGPAVSIFSQLGYIDATAFSTNGNYTDSGTIIAASTGVQKPILAQTAMPAGSSLNFKLISAATGAIDARIRIFYTQA